MLIKVMIGMLKNKIKMRVRFKKTKRKKIDNTMIITQ